ncbi:MAG: winged helix-turn-helix domain-containing protein, partial [Oscillospiraceae bacterium]|nr:winged helix-turn-helix domain-containing protein [Oscillospiraceae bacterium]
VRFRLNLLAEISNKYWALYRRLNYLNAGNMRARIAQYLLQIRAERESDSFVLPLTRETLAGELGVNRSALCRELGRMQREGLLAVRRSSFTILDAAALEQLGG